MYTVYHSFFLCSFLPIVKDNPFILSAISFPDGCSTGAGGFSEIISAKRAALSDGLCRLRFMGRYSLIWCRFYACIIAGGVESISALPVIVFGLKVHSQHDKWYLLKIADTKQVQFQ